MTASNRGMTVRTVAVPGGPTIRIDDARWAHLDARVSRAIVPIRRVYAAVHVVMRPEYAGVHHAVDAPGTAAEIASFVE